MKKSKFLLVAALSLIMALSMIGALSVNRKKALAADGDYTITAESGAQLRLNQDGGMRFRFFVDGATRDYVIANENVKIQFIIAPQSYFEAGVAENGGLKAFVTDEESNIYSSSTDDKYYVNGCIQKVNVKNVALDFRCRARIVEVGEDGQTVTNVIAYADSDVRNLYDVINKTILLEESSSEISILDSAKTPYSAWFGTEQYPVRIETQEEYEILKSKCNVEGSASFANVAVAVADGVTTSDSDFTEEANKPSVAAMHTVTFKNGDEIYATVKVKDGQTAVVPAINPRKSSDGTYVYTFEVWEGDLTSVTEDREITAKFTSEYIIDREVALWQAEGAVELQKSALNSTSVQDGTLGNYGVYKISDLKGKGGRQVGVGININNYEALYFAMKLTAKVKIFDGDNTPALEANKWYSIKLVKGTEHWNVYAKAFGESDYTEIVLNNYTRLASSGDMWFSSAFITVDWTSADLSYDVYATGLWSKEKEAYQKVEEIIEQLPDSATTVDEINNVMTADGAYNELSDEQKAKVSAESVEKLNTLLGSIFETEISAFQTAGATMRTERAIGNSTNPSALYSTVGKHNVYKIADLKSGSGAVNIGVGLNMNAYSTIYFCFKTTASLPIFDGKNTPNNLDANKWYSIKLVKGAEHWNVYAKAFGEEDYVEITLGNYGNLKITGDVWFHSEFKTVDWSGSGINFDVYATGLWAE